jgi:hypothetical protein
MERSLQQTLLLSLIYIVYYWDQFNSNQSLCLDCLRAHYSNGKFTAPSPESHHFLALVRTYSDMACGACGNELRYIKGTQDGAGRISYAFYFCDQCDVEWRLRRRKE